jgi:Flp pilus assembly protein TadG
MNQKARIETRIRLATRRGQASVEFALVLVILLGLVYGILEVSRLMFINAELENAAREGAHYISLHAADPTLAVDADARVKSHLVLADPNTANVAIPAFSPCVGCQVTVTVTYTWTSAVNFVPDIEHLTLRPLGPITLRTTATEIIESGGN